MTSRLLRTTALALLVSTGCRCDDEERRPYTPFGVATSAEPAQTTESTPDASTPGGDTFEVTAAEKHDPALEKVEHGAVTASRDGFLVSQSLLVKTDDGATIVAWLTQQAERPGAAPGQLWAFTEKGQRKLSDFPAFIPSDCARQVALAQTGPRSVSLDIDASCAGGIPRAPTRSLSVHRIERDNALLALRLAAVPEGESLALAVDSTDRDGDGHDDVAVRFTLDTKKTGKEASASLVWLDRAAGPAREDGEPGRSFEDIGSVEVVRSRGAKTSAGVEQRVDNARRLFAFLCQEGGTPRVTSVDGSTFRCGDLTTAFARYRLASLRAAISQKDWAAAVNRLARADWYGPPPTDKEHAELTGELNAALPIRPTARRQIGVRARAPGSAPRLSPLRFDDEGHLLVQTLTEVVKVVGPMMEDVSDSIDRWPLLSFSSSGLQATGVAFPCDENRVEVVARASAGNLRSVLRTEWLPPRPGPCGGHRPFYEPELRLVTWRGENLVAFVGAELFGEEPRNVAYGSPLSPDGKSSVVSTPVGLLVHGSSGTQRWEAGESPLSECVVANSGKAVACLDPSAVPVLVEPQAGASAK